METRKANLELEELTGKIIECAITVHKKLGPGFMESIYQSALPVELEKQGLKAGTQKEIKIYYEGKEVGLHRLDLVVEKQIIVELKAVKEFDETHLAQIISYLKATGLKVGLLLNFAKPVLKIKRVMN